MLKPAPQMDAVGEAKRGRPLRVALFGGFGIGNFGNDASLEAALAFLRAERPDVEISCICSNPPYVAEKYGLPTVATVLRPKGFWRKLDTLLLRQPSAWTNWVYCLWQLRRFDVVLAPGTGVFDDFRDTPWGWPSRLLRWCIASRLSGRRLAFLSVGAGPILSPVSRVMMKQAARLAHHRSYRDAGSRDYMQKLGVDESRSLVLPDVAFLLPPPPPSPRPANAKPVIGLGIMNYSGWRRSADVYEDYVQKHIRFVEWAEANGYALEVLTGQDTDWITVREIESRMGRKLTDKAESDLNSFHDVMNAVADTDIVVASRYHVQVAALKRGKPLLSLSYAPKNDALLASAGLGEFTQDVHAIDLDRLAQQVTELMNNRERYGEIVRTRVSAMEESLREAVAELDLLGD